MKKILASNELIFILVDDEDYERVKWYKWHVARYKNGNIAHIKTNIKISKGKYKSIYLHRFILNYEGSSMIDHKDGNPVNNQKENLRFVDHQQNKQNSRKHYNSKSKYKGPNWREDLQKWQSHIRVDGYLLSLGTFENEIDAALAYNKAAIKHFGVYARLNEIL